MLIESIKAATHEPEIRFKTETTGARQRVVNLAVAEVRQKASQGETVAELTLDHIVNAKYQLVSWLRHYFIKEGFNFSVSSTPEHITVSVKW
ncbi:TPA: hypothetical protein NGT07_004939 [Vibrio parahaemolyticus]|uniref:hypothetical protein n=1 Tax=Vibrio parahaemolyticus TaxID=670 RepID=UPI00112446F4|nr:hypothetical protein [Vibrio parahaemolyticus]TOF05958.1 hypothetical protein CGJ29_18485 [Vibrio parahaemolyticus]TOI28101.1 hypothetical protein CGI63_22950 [Vibrio parahaemolyticus]TOM55524.1 hypothetical protein CGH74_23010 [Vibrio parahaemolyticus]HCE4654330.1 hypothetical protein [Vibrio parahaemolyticus]HCE4659014.1 hypothetical protein [Vibrio parahaemolyticus]